MKNKYHFLNLLTIITGLTISSHAFSMGLRTFVALPVEKGGNVVRFQLLKNKNSDKLIVSGAYGLNAKQTLLLGMPYRLSPSGNNKQGDLSVLFRQMTIQDDSSSGTNRLGLLGGAIIPTDNDRDAAVQAGFVFTHFKDKNEIDMDLIYQKGLDTRVNAGRYDISWQHRLRPNERPDWGFSTELNSVLELNGRWKQGNNTSHQVTLGLQHITKKWVIEGGVSKELNNNNDVSYLLSTRFHF